MQNHNPRKNILEIQNLTVNLRSNQRIEPLIKGICFDVKEESIMALVGASGSGKTTLGLSILGLLPAAFQVAQGKITFQGKNILEYSPTQMQSLRGKEISMIFQESLSAFNPVFTIGSQINEVLEFHTSLNKQKRQQRVWQLLDIVEISDPKRVALQYPHQLSGGMRQRAMIAQAIAADCQLLIADEPTSNLDVTIQARIIELFRKLKLSLKISILLITHDLGVVAQLADEVSILSNGQIVEAGGAQEILKSPKHPFTIRLVEAAIA